MRRLTLVLALAVVTLAGCKKSKKDVQYVEEGGSQLSSAVNVADPKAAIQLLRGFHDVENSAWRWTGPKFAVALRPPKEVPAEGAKLFMEYAVPDLFMQQVAQIVQRVARDFLVQHAHDHWEPCSSSDRSSAEAALTPSVRPLTAFSQRQNSARRSC